MASRKLIILAKAPVAGHAKSRMMPLLGSDGAARLHQELTHWLLTKMGNSPDYETELWCASDIDHPFFVECAAEFAISLKLQQGDDLGERQLFAMMSGLANAKSVVMVGSDVASLIMSDIENAFQAIEQGKQVVIAPAEDGGYGLIGGSRVAKDLFSGIPWGTHQVYEAMVTNLNRLEFEWQALPEVWDLDCPEDLVRLGRHPLISEALLKILEVNRL
ncbi:MAG: TIGR04282 family arsenosugar biosynthesis glycosyltransferase [Gammaproteobacteria bacterium]|nr:TIGR04282 family arsenosugar biosynthesis glycosyltransferase [Gammaproteobacteria bacterium]